MQRTSIVNKKNSTCTAPTAVTSINASLSIRLFTLLAIKLLRRRQRRSGPVLFLSTKVCVRYGRHVTLNQALTIRFITAHTSLPVPRIHCAFVHDDRTYIVMERIDGEPLGKGWVKRSEENRTKFLGQLKSMVHEMRRIEPPRGHGVANVDGGSLYDPRLPGVSARLGLFRDVQEFHRYLRGGLGAHPQHTAAIQALISPQDAPSPHPVFTHADLSSLKHPCIRK